MLAWSYMVYRETVVFENKCEIRFLEQLGMDMKYLNAISGPMISAIIAKILYELQVKVGKILKPIFSILLENEDAFECQART